MAGLLSLPQPGDVVGGKYLLETAVHHSEYGVVFCARHRHTGRRFALHWLPTPLPDEFLREGVGGADVVGCFRHGLVLSPFDIGRVGNALYLVMEWLDGESLSDRLARLTKLSLAEAARLLTPCMRALHEAHLANIVHGDLRPGNIFICAASHDQPESVRIFDYSLVRPVRPAPLVTSDGQYTRHAFYVAPEIITGGSSIDRRSDVYAFGVMLYHALTGRLPFSSERPDDFARWLYAQEPPLPPRAAGMTPSVYRLVLSAMARDAAERFENCSDLANALETLVRSPWAEALDTPLSRDLLRRKRRAARVATLPWNVKAEGELLDAVTASSTALATDPMRPVFVRPRERQGLLLTPGLDSADDFVLLEEDEYEEDGSAAAVPDSFYGDECVPVGEPDAWAPDVTTGAAPDETLSEPVYRRDMPDGSDVSVAPVMFSPDSHERLSSPRPVDRRLLWAATCLAGVAVFQALVHFAPSLEERYDAVSQEPAVTPHALQSPTPTPPTAAAGAAPRDTTRPTVVEAAPPPAPSVMGAVPRPSTPASVQVPTAARDRPDALERAERTSPVAVRPAPSVRPTRPAASQLPVTARPAGRGPVQVKAAPEPERAEGMSLF